MKGAWLTRGLDVGKGLMVRPHLSASGRKEKGKGGGRAGPAEGQVGLRGPLAHGREKKAGGLFCSRAEKKRKTRNGSWGKERKGRLG
jgi:hypothetical protein